jgi:hypothetical protein
MQAVGVGQRTVDVEQQRLFQSWRHFQESPRTKTHSLRLAGGSAMVGAWKGTKTGPRKLGAVKTSRSKICSARQK